MFSSLRTVVLLVILAVVLVGAGIASVIINATSAGPPPVPTSAAAIAAATRSLPPYWVVAPGDTFTSIAARNHLTESQLQVLNPDQDPANVIAGQRLRLHEQVATAVKAHRRAPPASWIVRRGDTYSSIAAKTGVALGDIAQFNPKLNPSALVPGQRLKLRP
ncbi:MAG: hypothetical protein QOF77_1058 [Solirubrobacteraceae bacterium]|jgi:LysM repeat protein|nr:hypothetical protein [Solirubrobacteraceae bacterium]